MKPLKYYIKIPLIVLLVLILQFIYFNYIATSNIGKIQKQEAQLENLRDTIEDLQNRLHESEKASFVSMHKIPDRVVFCMDTLDITNQVIRERLEREFYSLLSQQGQIQLYLKRGIKYTDMIEKYLNSSGLPNDLKYLAIHESALLPDIRSRSNAVGLWQFMRATGRLYGLKINRYIDERRHPEKATKSAIRFLSELYRYYGNWPVVLAAYNGGHGRVSRAIKNQSTTSFFDLSLPEETERYYFKIVATKILLSHPEKYGFKLQEKDLFKPVRTISVELEVESNKKTIEEISSQCEISIAEFKFLNPQIINSYLPRGTYSVNIPIDKANVFANKKVPSEDETFPEN